MLNQDGTSLVLDRIKASTTSQSIAVSRFQAMDIQRGFIMMLMGLSHCPEFIGSHHYSNFDWFKTGLWLSANPFDLILQLVSITVAGGFFMLMGMGMIYFYHARLKNGWPINRICRYFMIRGLLLIFIQLTILQAFEWFAEEKFYIYLGVLFTLGGCMMIGAGLLWIIHQLKNSLQTLVTFRVSSLRLEYIIPILLIVMILYGIQLGIDNLHQTGIKPTLSQVFFWVSGHYHAIDVNFTPLPWMPAVLFGMILGESLYENQTKTLRFIGTLSVVFLITWLFLRTGHLSGWWHFGEYRQLDVTQAKFADLLVVSKYPPSISYFLLSLGINLGCIYLFQQLLNQPNWSDRLKPIRLFGQCALFFFVCHWFVYLACGRLLSDETTGTLGILGIWLLGLTILYPLCLKFLAFKRGTAADSYWRLF